MSHRDYAYYIGMAGAIAMGVSDMVMLGTPHAGWQTDMASYAAIPEIPLWRVEIGSRLGLVASVFICFGYWYVSGLFTTSHPRLATCLFVSLSAMMLMGGVFHGGYYYYAISPTAQRMALLVMLSYCSIPGLLIGAWSHQRLTVGTRLQYANPILFLALTLVLFSAIPAPVGGWIKPTFVNVATMLFFMVHRYLLSLETKHRIRPNYRPPYRITTLFAIFATQ